MSDRRVAAAAFFTLTVFARVAGAQTPATPTVGVPAFFRILYAPVTQDVLANGGPALSAANFGGAVVLSSLLVAQLTRLPTASNAGGLTWTYDSALGTWSRVVDSFGPHVGERAETIGRRKLNFGFAYQRFTFDRLNGQSMPTAAIESNAALSAVAPRLILQERVSLSRADIDLTTVFVNYGITSRIDVGVFLPSVSVALDGSVAYTLRRGSSILAQRTNTAAGRSRVMGDPVFRGKWNVIRRSRGGLAVAADARFHSKNPLGSGGLKLQVIASGNAAAVNTHASVGFSGSECNNTADKACGSVGGFFVAGGIDKAVTNRLTLATDVQLQRVDFGLRFAQTIPTGAVQRGTVFEGLSVRADPVTVAMTGRINAWGNLLVTVTALIPANSQGLTDQFTPIIGLDYAW